MFSAKFLRTIILTKHAIKRMSDRFVSDEMLIKIIDTGKIRYKDETHLWIFVDFPNRTDNSLCAVLVLEDALIVKTVMHHFSLR